MSDTILVTGGTGTIGSAVVPLLQDSGRPIRVLSRHPCPAADIAADGVRYVVGDTVKNIGLPDALLGVKVVLHLAGGASGDDIAAHNLVAAARQADVQHLVLISVVGADRMPLGYFRRKAAAESTITESGIPWTCIRVAQLHAFIEPVARALRRLPVLLAPTGLRFEPIDLNDVAQRLAELTLGTPVGRVTDLAGPEVLDIPRLVATYAESRGRRPRPRLNLPLAGAVGRAYRAGENLAGADADHGSITWEHYLASESSHSPKSSVHRRID